MKYCNHCKVSICTNDSKCPLCLMSLVSKDTEPIIPIFPPIDNPFISYNLNFRILLFISIAVCAISLVVNLLVPTRFFWAPIVIGSTLYMWTTIKISLTRKVNVGRTILLQVIGISALTFIIDWFIGFKNWSLNFVTPLIIIAATLTISIIILVKDMRWRDCLIYLIILGLMGFIPLILLAVGLITIKWTAIFAAFYAFLTLVGLFIFADKKMKNEITKRFHV